jgi:predicted transposase YdaD
MHEYDISLKLLLRGSGAGVLRELTGGIAVEKWLDVEMPEMQNTRVDLLGETAAGSLIHVELQSANDVTMPLRMLEYYVRVYRLFNRFPSQILLYVGTAPLRMPAELIGPDLSFRYRAVDIRDLDGDRLLESDRVGDNVIAILARLHDRQQAVSRILTRIATLGPAERETALTQLIRLAGLRRLEEYVEREARKMPLLDDIMDNKVLGREYKRGRAEGLQEGELKGELKGKLTGQLEGKLEGKLEGELTILRRLVEKRFGPIPDWAEERLRSQSAAELEALSVGVLDAQSIEELLK